MLTYFRMLMGRITPIASNQRGATMVEYALIVAVISVVVIATAVLISPQLQTVFQSVLTALTDANAA